MVGSLPVTLDRRWVGMEAARTTSVSVGPDMKVAHAASGTAGAATEAVIVALGAADTATKAFYACITLTVGR